MISNSDAVSLRRAAVWTAEGLGFAATLIPSPVTVTGGPIQTVFAGNTGGENALTVCTLLLLAVPLVIAGRSSACIAIVIALAWLPGAAGPLLGWYVLRLSILRFDAWYYVSWLAWLIVAMLTLAETYAWLKHRRCTEPVGCCSCCLPRSGHRIASPRHRTAQTAVSTAAPEGCPALDASFATR